MLTCLANDVCYDAVFSRQVEALGRPGDVLFALSTSGNSPNILAALAAGRERGLFTVGFTGVAGAARMSPSCAAVLAVPSTDCARIQECHEFLCHVIAGMVETSLFGAGKPSRGGRECAPG